MKIMFMGLPGHPVHIELDITVGQKSRFINDGEYEVTDAFGAHLIKNHPMLFGTSVDDILKARGTEEQPTPRKIPTATVEKQVAAKQIHPRNEAMRKAKIKDVRSKKPVGKEAPRHPFTKITQPKPDKGAN